MALLQQVPSEPESGVKKLVSVSATFMPMTRTREEVVEAAKSVGTAKAVETVEVDKDGKESEDEYPNLAQVPCIWYPITFRKKSVSVLALLDPGSEVNTIHSSLAQELGLPIRRTDVGAQKIDGIILDTFGMVVTVFSMINKANQVRLFEKTFLVANVSPKILLRMLFLTWSGADVDFWGRGLWCRTYITEEALSTIRYVELVGKKEFAAAALNLEHETYIVHFGSVNSNALTSSFPLDIHPFCRFQIFVLISEKALIKVPAEYSDFADVFFPDLASELSEQTGINNHTI